MIHLKDSVHEYGEPTGKRGIVVGTEFRGKTTWYIVRWENGLTNSYLRGQLTVVGNVLDPILTRKQQRLLDELYNEGVLTR